MSGKALVSGRCWRDCSMTSSWRQKASARNPSSFGSNTHAGPAGSRVTRVAAIGATGGSTGGSLRGGFGLPTAAR